MNSIIGILISGFSIGALGSLHCVGMCGPLAMSLPFYEQHGNRKFIAIAFYNIGRITTYTLLGLLFGLTGRGLYLFGIQQWISLIAGVSILCILVLPKIFHFSIAGNFIKQQSVLSFFSRYISAGNNMGSFYTAGFVNGLLPCGLVYVAIASSVATGSIAMGALLMFSFGLGTLPLMIATIAAGKLISVQLRNRLKALVPWLVALVAVLLIIRGLGLNIPYLSPAIQNHNLPSCHP